MKKKRRLFALLAFSSIFMFGIGFAACTDSKPDDSTLQEEESKIDLTGEKSVVSNIAKEMGVYSILDIGKCYGLCNGYRFACKAEITTPSGETVAVDSQYTVAEEGEYKVKLASLIGGEKVEDTFTIQVEGYSAQGLFSCSNATYLQGEKAVAENLNTELRSGAQFQLNANNSTVSFKPVVDLNDLKGDSLSSLIEFTTNANSTNLPDLRGLRVVLTDVYDSSNTVGITFTMSSTILIAERNEAIEEFTAAVPFMKAEWNGYSVGDDSLFPEVPGNTIPFGCSFMPQFHLASKKESSFFAMNVYYDAEEKAIYTKGDQGTLLVYDMDNPLDSYGDFKGFTTGEVYVSVESTGTGGDIVITKIGDYTFDGVTEDSYRKANDTLLFNGYDFAHMLNGVVGYAYPLPQALYGEAVTTKLYKVDGETETELAFHDGFTPSEAGRYAIICAALNEYGYEVSVKGYFDVLQDAVEITAPSVELQAKLLDVWKIPALTFEGGIGKLSLQYTLQKGGKTYDVMPNDAVCLDTKGEAVNLSVKVTDEIGYWRTFTFPLTIDCNVMQFELLDTFDAIVVNEGMTVTVPDYIAIDYAQDDVSKNNVEITIKQGKTKVLSVGDEITVRSDSNLSYYAGETLLKTFTIRCLKTFVEGGSVAEQFTALSGIDRIATATHGTAFTLTEENAFLQMPYAVSSSGLNIQFGVFSDMLDASVLVKLRSLSGQELHYELTDLGAEPTLLINGEKTYCKVSVNKTTYKEADLPEYYNYEYYTYSFMVDGAKSTLYNGASLRIGTIDRWKDGLPFDGFVKGAVQVSFEVKNGRPNGAFLLEKVSNQGLTSVHLEKGEKISPMIAFDGLFGSTMVEKDSVVAIPLAYVYDVFDAKSSVSMSVMSPNGAYLLKKSPASEYSFTASEYGIYYVSYDVRDSKGNTDTLNYLIVVSDDVAPTLTVNGSYQSEYKGKVTIHSATATDNVDGELPVTVWIEQADKTTREVAMGETVSLEKGTYEIVYYTMDENGNFAVRRFVVTVK